MWFYLKGINGLCLSSSRLLLLSHIIIIFAVFLIYKRQAYPWWLLFMIKHVGFVVPVRIKE